MIVRQTVLGETTEERTETYLAKLNIWSSMAHHVAKTLHLRPNDILNHWGCAELLVAFGEYANEEAASALDQWEHTYGNKKGITPKKPKPYVVEFIDG